MQRYNSREDLLGALKMLKEDAILVDMFLPRMRKDIFLPDAELEISLIPCKYLQGVLLKGRATRLAEDIEEFAKMENIQIKLLLEQENNEEVGVSQWSEQMLWLH